MAFMIWFIVVFEGYYVSEVFGAYLTCKLFFYKCKVTLHFVTVMIAKMYLHIRYLVTLFTSGVYDKVYCGIPGLLCKRSVWGISHMQNRILMVAGQDRELK